MSNGIITVALPVIASSLSIPNSLYLWPASVYGLTCGATLLMAGSIADLIGARNVELVGIFLVSTFALAQSLASTGVQLIVFRALQGIGLAMHIPASVSLVAAGVPEGRARNFRFACLGMSQPLGFSVGLVASGIMIERAGRRSAFYFSAAGLFLATIPTFWVLAKVQANLEREWSIWMEIWKEIDWVGGVLASKCILSADLAAFKKTTTIVLFVISVVLMLAFPIWMRYRERIGKPALVPNSLWKNTTFTATCVMLALSYGVTNSMALFSSLFFQEIQHKSTLTTSLYILPNLGVGVLLSLSTGLLVHRWPARWFVVTSAFLCALSPLMMALVPLAGIIVSSNFPKETQASAGAVFSTVGMSGHSFGLGICQLVALGAAGTAGEGNDKGNGVSEGEHGGAFSGYGDAAVLDGCRAAFWTMFACMVSVGLIAVHGLRKTGKIGLKRE
ncbi:major facilitator superfamily domain-containing protein [Leptodontidium sp. MPI-SDFR-AT-0119]|nr:major facilitator superfamily domain-containing protein [Leptodontidium sp. MPI-SDFR-AT-0119]